VIYLSRRHLPAAAVAAAACVYLLLPLVLVVGECVYSLFFFFFFFFFSFLPHTNSRLCISSFHIHAPTQTQLERVHGRPGFARVVSNHLFNSCRVITKFTLNLNFLSLKTFSPVLQ